MNKETKTFIFSYRHDGALWDIEIHAYDVNDAIDRVKKLSSEAEYVGILDCKISVFDEKTARLKDSN